MHLACLLLVFFADIIHLKSGGRIEGKVLEREEGRVRIQTKHGIVEFRESQIERIEEKPWTLPEKEAPAKEKRRPKKAPKLGRTYREPWVNFRITLPKGWKPVKAEDGASVTFEGPKFMAYVPKMHLFLESNKLPLLEFAEQHEKQLKAQKELQDLRFRILAIESGKTRSSILAVASYNDGLVDIETTWTFVDAGGRKATFVWTCFAKLAEQYRDEVRAGMDSIRMFKPNKASRGKQALFQQLLRDAVRLRRDEDSAGAAEKLREASGIAPNFPDTHNQLGQVLGNLGNLEGAEKAFRRAHALDPEEPAYMLDTSRILYQRRKNDEALKLARKAAELKPDSPEMRIHLGAVALRLEKFELAEGSYIRAVELDPESIEAHYGLGVTYESKHDLNKAAREYRDVLKIDPAHAGAKQGLERVRD